MPEQTINVRHCGKAGRDIFLCYEAFGNPNDDPLILIPGLSTQMIAYKEPLCEQLVQRGFYVIRMDNRDYGLSIHLDHLPIPNPIKIKAKSYLKKIPESAVPYTLKDMGEDVIGLMDKLGFAKATVLGMSMGGMIGQEMAINWPDRVRGLVLVMTTPGGSVATDASIWTQLKLLKKAPTDEEGMIKHGVWILGEVGGRSKHFDEKVCEEYVRRAHKRSDYKIGAGRQIAAILQGNRDGRAAKLGKVNVPVAIVHGANDILVPVANARALHKAIPGSELTIVPEMGHDMWPHCWPAWFDAAVGVNRKGKEKDGHHIDAATNHQNSAPPSTMAAAAQPSTPVVAREATPPPSTTTAVAAPTASESEEGAGAGREEEESQNITAI